MRNIIFLVHKPGTSRLLRMHTVEIITVTDHSHLNFLCMTVGLSIHSTFFTEVWNFVVYNSTRVPRWFCGGQWTQRISAHIHSRLIHIWYGVIWGQACDSCGRRLGDLARRSEE